MYYVYADGESIYNPLDETLGIVSPKVSLELGKAGSFQFDLPPSNTYYNRLSQLKTIITVYLDDAEIFRGRVFSIERKFNKMKTVYCEGVLAYLVDSVQKAKTYKGKAHAFFRKIISGHNTMMGTVSAEKKFTVGNIEIEDADVIIPGKKDDDDKYYGSKYAQAIIESIVDEWLTTFDYINDVLIDYLGGYLVARYSNGKNYIDYISTDSLDKAIEEAEQRGSGYKEIEFGTNLIDLTEEINAEELFTVLIPLGDDNLTVKSVNKNSIEIVDEAAVARYGRIVKTHVFDNVNSASTLLSDGKKYLKAHKNIPVSFTVRALDMHFIDESNRIIEIGEVVKVKSNPHDISRILICTKIEYDLQNPANNTYTFGNPKQSMTERYKKNKDKEKKESKKHASSGGGAGAGAAKDDAVEEAVADAGKEADSKLKSFYDAWINVDPESGHIDLGTLYKLASGALSRAGIELDSGEQGSKINIFTNDDRLGKAETAITSTSDTLHAEIDAYAKYNNDKVAGLTLLANNNESLLKLFTNYKTDKDGKVITSDTAIEQMSNEMFSKISSTASYKKDVGDKINTATSGIKQTANNNMAVLKSFTEYRVDPKTGEALVSDTDITQMATELFSKISSTAKYKSDVADSMTKISQRATNSMAAIELVASFNKDSKGKPVSLSLLNTETKKQIKAVCNEFIVEGGIKSDWVTSGNITISGKNKGLSAGSLSASTLSITGSAAIKDATLSGSPKVLYSGLNRDILHTGNISDTVNSDYIKKKLTGAIVRTKFLEGLAGNYKSIPEYIVSHINLTTVNSALGVGKEDAVATQGWVEGLLASYLKTSDFTTDNVRSKFQGNYSSMALYVAGLLSGQSISPSTVYASGEVRGNPVKRLDGSKYHTCTTNQHTHKYEFEVDIGHQHKLNDGTYTLGMKSGSKIKVSKSTKAPT